MKILKKIVFCIAVCVFVFSGVTLFQYFNESKASQKEYIENPSAKLAEGYHDPSGLEENTPDLPSCNRSVVANAFPVGAVTHQVGLAIGIVEELTAATVIRLTAGVNTAGVSIIFQNQLAPKCKSRIQLEGLKCDLRARICFLHLFIPPHRRNDDL